MNAPMIIASLAVGVLALAGCGGKRSQTMATTKPADAARISGPYTHENLTVYLIHGPDRQLAAKYLTLQEAMEQKKVVVHETGNVNELSIENVSDELVYIQCGDIVKGGKQDRTIATDFIASGHGGKVPIAAFCVEQNRWQRRGSESIAGFSSSAYMVAGKDMKRYSNTALAGDQGAVWSLASRSSAQLSANLSRQVQADASPSSFQLALENVQRDTDAYCAELNRAVETKPDVIGWAYAVNGQLSGANIYGSHDLFRKLWPKLLRSGAVEAIAERPSEPKTDRAIPSTDDVRAFLANAEQAAPKSTPVNDRTACEVYESEETVLLQTEDRQSKQWIHRGYIKK